MRRFTTAVRLIDLAVMDDGRTTLVVGNYGTLLKSVNAGATWRSLADNVIWRETTPPDDLSRTSMLEQLDLFQSEATDVFVAGSTGGEDDEATRARTLRIFEAYREHDNGQSWKAAQGVGVESPWPTDESEIEQFRNLSDGIHV